MSEPTFDDVDALVGPATPHFAFQIRARVRELVAGLPEDHPVHRYAMERLDELDRLGFASTLAADSEHRRAAHATRLGADPVVGAGVGTAARPTGEDGSIREHLTGSTVLVTGGSRGIGKAIALRLARLGAARVAIGYFRSDAAAEETADELRALGAEPVLVRGNVTSERVCSSRWPRSARCASSCTTPPPG